MPAVDLDRIIQTLGSVARILRDEPGKALEQLREISGDIDGQIPYRDGHSLRVSDLALKTGEQMGLSDYELVTLEAAALLHDFGKIGVEDDILVKPASLVDQERTEVERHVLRGYHILSGFVELEEALKGVRTHHEHYDGMGYPAGLMDGNIPLIGRIIAVADAFDAMMSDRPYRKARSREYAISELHKFSGSQFDPKVVQVFLTII